jgi:hypothetical protein
LPAPVSRYIDSSSAWKASSKISSRWRRRKPKSFRLFSSRFRMNCSRLVTVALGRHRSIATSARAQARSKAKRITAGCGLSIPGV